jgi:Uncharacterized conserved protein
MSNFDNIPDELQERDQWLLWDSSADSPRQPHWNGDFYGISWSDPDDWHSFDEAVSMAATTDSWGIGYVMAKDNDDHARGLYGCLDLDGVHDPETGRSKDWVPGLSAFFQEGEGYVEFSPSGTGIHIPLVGQDEPDWWADSHFTDGEHEGVEYLTNKFVTFTGNKLTGAGSKVSDADPAPFLHECYKIINDESPVQQETHSYDGDVDAELSVEEMETALEHIDSNCGYTDWRRIIYAIHDWDSGSTGRQLAEDWSRSSAGWDDDAGQHLDSIWSNADEGPSNKEATVGSIIHKANENGWTSSSGSGSGSDTPDVRGATHEANTDGGEDTDTDETDDGTFTWDMVYNGYQNADRADDRMPYRYGATEIMSREDHWRNVAETDILWRYVRPNGDP